MSQADGPVPSKRPKVDEGTEEKVSTPSSTSSTQTYSDLINITYLSEQTSTEEATIKFCQYYGLLPISTQCPKCEATLDKIHFQKTDQNSKHLFRCRKRACQFSVSPRKGTWFEGTKLSLRKALVLTYMFIRKADYKSAIFETSGPCFKDLTTSSETVADTYRYCREVCAEALSLCKPSSQIGGPEHIVEIDEANFGKRKFYRGRLVEGQSMVLGGICRETREGFFVPIADRSAETLLAIIKEKVAPGSVIHTDAWRAYVGLSECGFQHRTVNHDSDAQTFVDPYTGVHTNSIENTWWCLKRALPSTHTRKADYAGHFAEFMWRKKNENCKCLYTQFLKDIAQIYPGL